MSLGFERELNVTNKGDTAEVYAYIYDRSDNPVDESDLLTVDFTIQAPDESQTTVQGEITEDGTGYVRYEDTTQIGQYLVSAQFAFTDGQKRSSRADFEVVDPLEVLVPTATEIVGNAVWAKIEDCFDAEDEGPWLRDMTLNTFNEKKMPMFISEGLFDINQANPPTSAVVGEFVVSGGPGIYPELPLLASATFLSVIRHLMRSYVEQPQPQGANVVYEDRRDYLQRWGTVYQIELQNYQRWLALWKRQFLGLGHSKVLVSSKAGRLIPAPMRSRSIGRGYY